MEDKYIVLLSMFGFFIGLAAFWVVWLLGTWLCCGCCLRTQDVSCNRLWFCCTTDWDYKMAHKAERMTEKATEIETAGKQFAYSMQNYQHTFDKRMNNVERLLGELMANKDKQELKELVIEK